MTLKTSIGFPWEVENAETVFPTLTCKTADGSTVIVRFEPTHPSKGPGFFVLDGGSYIGGPNDAQQAIDYAEGRIRAKTAKYIDDLRRKLTHADAFAKKVGI